MATRNEANSSNTAREALPARPLFAAASIFPSGNIAQDYTISTSTRLQDAESREDNDLSSLKLQLNPATLAAIISAQKPDNDLLQQSLSPESVQGASSDEDLQGENKAHKRKQADSENDDAEQNTSPKRRKHHKKKKHKHKKKSHSKSLESKESLMLNPPDIPKHAIFLDDIKDLNQQPAYRLDTKANRDLWHYKSVSKLHVPKYKPRIVNCLGASHIFIKDLRNENKGRIKKGLPRYFQKGCIKYIHKKGLEFTSSGNKESQNFSGDFIAILQEDLERDSKTHVTGNYSCLDDATASYVQGKHADLNKQSETQSENLVMDEIFEKVRRYNERTRADPHNVQLWLEFVQFQDVVAQEDKSFTGQTIHLRQRYQTSKSVIEKKLAILDKALETNPSSLELKLAQLELYQDIWESDKLEKAWGDLLFIHSASVDLWQHYLLKQQSRLFKFSFSRILKCYHKSFKTLVPILDGQVKALNKKEDMEEKLLELFCQYCSFLHQTGYTERAVSCYQAVIEFNLFCPAHLRLNITQDRMKQFEQFWDSSAPRFGEVKAKGWAEWSENRHTLGVSSNSENTQEQEDAVILEKLSRSQKWLKMEKIRQNVHWLPWRPDTEKGETMESCEDLDRVVLFEDISPAVFRITKLESHIRIVCLFLKFLGLSSEVLEKALQVSGMTLSSGQFDQYSRVSLAQYPFLSLIKCGLEVDSAWRPHESLAAFISEVLVQTEAYCSLPSRVVFTCLRLELEVLKLGVFRVSELSKSDVKKAKRFGKSLLKENQNRSNLVVWDFYIRFLWACSDNMEETVSMLDTALAMFMGTFTLSDLNNTLGLCLLCRTYCQIILNFEPLEHIKASGHRSVPSVEDKHQAIACLGALVENKGFKPSSKPQVSPAYVLKIRNRFQGNLNVICNKVEHSLEPSLTDLIVAYTDCFALFEYCASGFKAAGQIYNSARESVKRYSQSVVQKDPLMNSLFQQLYSAHLSFCLNAMHICFIPLSETRHVLTQALQEFPECPQFHSLFLEIESGSRIAGRLRRYYEKSWRNTTSLSVPLFAVLSELTRHYTVIRGLELADFQQTDTGVVHRVRSVFEHCLQGDISGHCPLLWRLFLMFEAKYGSQSRAKGIFYRALQSCPWAKCIYLDGIAIFGDSELQEVMDLMTEEEIRIRMPLEELDLLLTAEDDLDDIKTEECSSDLSDHAAYVDSENAKIGTVSSNTGIHST